MNVARLVAFGSKSSAIEEREDQSRWAGSLFDKIVISGGLMRRSVKLWGGGKQTGQLYRGEAPWVWRRKRLKRRSCLGRDREIRCFSFFFNQSLMLEVDEIPD